MDRSDLFVAKVGGYRRYRIPALVVSAKGTVLAFCEARRHTGADDDEIDIQLRRSTDNGELWSESAVVVSDGDRTCGNPCPVVDHVTGAVVLPFCKDNRQVFVTTSLDDGLTWSDPREITSQVKDPAWAYLGLGPGHGIQLSSGRLLIPSWCDESSGDPTWREPPAVWGKVQSSFAFYSDDHGDTWQGGKKLTHDASDECEAVEVEDGLLYATLRSRQDRRCRGLAWSRDGGETWSDVEYDPALPEPSCQAGLARFDGNRFLLTHPSNAEQRTELTVRLSDDGCRSWSRSRLLEPGPAAYSDLAVAPNGRILCLYEADDYDRLELASFPIEWLEE